MSDNLPTEEVTKRAFGCPGHWLTLGCRFHSDMRDCNQFMRAEEERKKRLQKIFDTDGNGLAAEHDDKLTEHERLGDLETYNQ